MEGRSTVSKALWKSMKFKYSEDCHLRLCSRTGVICSAEDLPGLKPLCFSFNLLHVDGFLNPLQDKSGIDLAEQ